MDKEKQTGAALGLWRLIPSVELIRYVPMEKAAKRLYGKTRRSPLAGFAEKNGGGSPERTLTWYGYWMVQNGVRIYGRRLPSHKLELIPYEDLRRMLFKNDVTSLYESNATNPTFIDLSVKRTDLIKRHDELRARKNPS